MHDTKQKEKELNSLAAKYTAYNMASSGVYVYAIGEYSKASDSLLNIIQVAIKAESESKALHELIARVTEYNTASKNTVRQIA